MSNWKNVSLVKRGLSHNSSNANCQDSVSVAENENLLVAALADGLGSLRYSELASEVATQAICDFFINLQEELNNNVAPLSEKIVSYVKSAIESKAEEKSLPVSEMDCTLSFVCILKSSNTAIVGLLGDSAICVMSGKKSIVLNDGNKSANGTYAILDEDASDHLIIRSVDLDKNDILGFILTSDGLENELYTKGSSRIQKIAASYFNTLTDADNSEKTIRERINKITSIEGSPFDDDISIVILSRADEEIDLPSDPTWLCSCGERNPLQNTYCQACHKDFVALYGKYRFKEYGGKAAFFDAINANPNEERKIVGLPVSGLPGPASQRVYQSQHETTGHDHTAILPNQLAADTRKVDVIQPESDKVKEDGEKAAFSDAINASPKEERKNADLPVSVLPDPTIQVEQKFQYETTGRDHTAFFPNQTAADIRKKDVTRPASNVGDISKIAEAKPEKSTDRKVAPTPRNSAHSTKPVEIQPKGTRTREEGAHKKTGDVKSQKNRFNPQSSGRTSKKSNRPIAIGILLSLLCIFFFIAGRISTKAVVRDLLSDYETQLSRQKEAYEAQISQLEEEIASDYEAQLSQQKEAYEKQISQLEEKIASEYETQLSQQKEAYEEQISQLEERISELEEELNKEQLGLRLERYSKDET